MVITKLRIPYNVNNVINKTFNSCKQFKLNEVTFNSSGKNSIVKDRVKK